MVEWVIVVGSVVVTVWVVDLVTVAVVVVMVEAVTVDAAIASAVPGTFGEDEGRLVLLAATK